MDDFVTAESQHFNSAMNSLVQDRYKYNPIRESTFTTTAQPPITTPIAATTATVAPPHKTLLQDFLEEMLRDDKAATTTRVTTEFPVWTTSTPMTTTYASANDEDTTTKETQVPIITTLTPSTDEEQPTTTTNDSFEESTKNDLDKATTTFSPEQIAQLSIGENLAKSDDSHRAASSQEDKTAEQNSLENVGIITQRYKLPSTYSGASEGHSSTTELPRDNEKEHIMTLKRPAGSVEENEAHPKNHRAKWSEVRYPSAFDKSQSALKQHSTVPGFATRSDGEASVKTLSDYVAAIFDSMKSGDEEVARVTEAGHESTAEDDRFNDVASVSEVSAETSVVATTEPLLRDATQRVEDNSEAQTDTTKEEDSATTTLESTDAPSEEETTPRIAASTEKTSLDRTADRANSTMAMLNKVLRTSTTTRVSHMTEICYRGRCVMTKPKMEDATR